MTHLHRIRLLFVLTISAALAIPAAALANAQPFWCETLPVVQREVCVGAPYSSGSTLSPPSPPTPQ